MQNNDSRLKIHTAVQHEQKTEPVEEQVKWESVPHPDDTAGKGKRRGSLRAGLTIGERLIRNTAIAGAILLCVLAVRNVDQPWSTQALSGLKQAMTMRVDWDESIGRLSFVRALVPDTALVFLNMSDEANLTAPVEGQLAHDYTEQQPWYEYSCEAGAEVVAAAEGRVTAAAQGMSGDWIVLVEHADSMETVYAYLADAAVQVGQTVAAGDVIGHVSAAQDARLYFELREADAAVDPTGRMK